MSTAFATIVTALMASLQASPAVSTHIYRNLQRPLPEQVSSAVVVRLSSALPERNELAGNPIDFTTPIAIECYARTTSITPDLAVDDLLQAAYTRLMQDQSLGGLVSDINLIGIQFGFDAEVDKFAVATLTLDVRHRTSGLTLT